MVRVINNKDRIYNGAKKGQILEVDKTKLDDYIQAGFSVVKDKIEKKNIVADTKTQRTGKECKEILDHAGIEYDKKLRVAELNKLVDEFESEKTTDNPNSDNISYGELLVKEGILDESEIEGKTDEELKGIATDNGLI